MVNNKRDVIGSFLFDLKAKSSTEDKFSKPWENHCKGPVAKVQQNQASSNNAK